MENNYNNETIESFKKGNRLCDDKARRKKRKKEKREKNQESNGKKKINKKKILKIILIVLAVLILLLGITIGTYVYKADGNIATAALNMAADVIGEDDPIFVLVLGISEDISAALTDTIILAGYNPDSQKAFMLSIPRDTFVGTGEAWASGYDKINALYQKGPEKTIEAVEKLTGIKIDYYAIVKNTALPAIVNAIGQVEFDVPIDMDYDDPTQNLHIHLKAGTQMIDGDKAEQLLRFRHNNDGSSYPTEYGDNDYGRMRTQREFIKAIAKQLMANGTTVSGLRNLATAVFDNLVTDISLTKMLAYAPSVLELNVDGIRMEQLPGSSTKLNNLWFYKHSNSETYDLVNELLTELALDEKELKEVYTPTKRTNTSSSTTSTKTNTEKETEETCSHYYSSKVTKEATCKEEGERQLTCSRCGEQITEKISKLEHELQTKTTVTNSKETTTVTCKNCDYTKTTTKDVEKNNTVKDENISDTCEHSYTETITKEVTCKEEGTKTYTCSKCKDSYTKTIPKTNKHTMSNGTCSICGYTEQHTHSYLETSTSAATCTSAGTKTSKCSCGDTKTDTIPATGHSYDSNGVCSSCGDPNGPVTAPAPETPDSSTNVSAGEVTE